MIRFFNPEGIVKPASLYSHAAATDQQMRWLHVSGQVGLTPSGVLQDGFEAQLEQCFANVIAVVRSDGMNIANIVKLVIYVTPPPHEVVGIYRDVRDRMMKLHPAAATYVGVTGLASPELLVEVEAVAAMPIIAK